MQENSNFRILSIVSVGCLASVFLFFHFFGLSSLSRGFDSAVLKAGVERVYWLGGSFYTTMFTHKGPLWSFEHFLAYSLGRADYFWEAAGFLILAIALMKGGLLFLCTRILTANRWFRISFVLFVTLYLVSGIEQYTYRLYSRNLSELYLLIAATIMWWGSYQRWPLPFIAVASAFLMGQAVLIMPTAAISGSIIALIFLWEVRGQLLREDPKGYLFGLTSNPNRSSSKNFFLILGLFFFASLFSVLITPFWYWNKGEFQEFWNGWYVYNTYYTEATSQSSWQILQKGIQDFIRHRLNLAQIILFLLDLFLVVHVSIHYKRENRLFCLMLWSCYGWCFGGIFQVILSQRFFSHYLICFVLPLLILNCLLVLYYLRSFEQKRIWLLIPSVIFLLGAVSISSKTMFVGVKQFLYFDFYHDPQTHADRIDFQLFRKVKLVQHFTDPDEFIYIWGGDDVRDWEHYQRPHATRYIEQRWLIGRIYGGDIQQKWILPGTWQKWEKDMGVTPPKAIVVETPSHIDVSHVKISKYPRLERILKEQYQLTYSDERASIFIEKERMAERIESFDASLPQNHYREDCEGKEFSITEKEGRYQLSYAIRSVSNSRHFLIDVDKQTLTSHSFHLYFLFKQIKSLRLEFVDAKNIRLHWHFFNRETKVCQAMLIS